MMPAVIKCEVFVLPLPVSLTSCYSYRFTFMSQCWELDANKRPTFTCLVSSLSQSLEDMADYMDVTAFGVTMPNTNVDVSGESNEQRYHKI